jgi:hypothetical protein
MRLIDADKFAEDVCILPAIDEHSANAVIFLLHEQPTVDIKTEVAREIFAEMEKQIARYTHIHRNADEARQCTEEYADGTPCEMVSVWEVISLHKNGWDDYETMNQLEDNIRNIANSRLLKEFESDIAELKNKYIGGVGE